MTTKAGIGACESHVVVDLNHRISRAERWSCSFELFVLDVCTKRMMQLGLLWVAGTVLLSSLLW
jgi:hypothetical protein